MSVASAMPPMAPKRVAVAEASDNESDGDVGRSVFVVTDATHVAIPNQQQFAGVTFVTKKIDDRKYLAFSNSARRLERLLCLASGVGWKPRKRNVSVANVLAKMRAARNAKFHEMMSERGVASGSDHKRRRYTVRGIVDKVLSLPETCDIRVESEHHVAEFTVLTARPGSTLWVELRTNVFDDVLKLMLDEVEGQKTGDLSEDKPQLEAIADDKEKEAHIEGDIENAQIE